MAPIKPRPVLGRIFCAVCLIGAGALGPYGPAFAQTGGDPLTEDNWFGQPPLATLPSPATNSLLGLTVSHAPALSPSETPHPTGKKPRTVAADPVLPPPPIPQMPVAAPVADPDSFIALDGGYSLYRNGRYGTTISYPSSYFLPEPPPANGDGRRFTSVDGAAKFYVYAQYNAEFLTQSAQIARDKSDSAHGTVSYERAGPGWYVLSGLTGPNIYYRRVIEDASGLIQVFEITYPQVRKTDFDPVVAYMAKTFAGGT